MYPYDENEENSPFAKIKNPLVRDYMRQKLEAKKKLDEAEQSQRVGDYADVAGNIASGLVNANKPEDVILYNSFGQMGSAPKLNKVADQKVDFTPAKSILDSQAARERSKYEQVGKDFEDSLKVSEVDRALQKQDANSSQSKSAQLLAKSALASKAKEAEAAGDKDAAKALREMDLSNLSAAEAKDFYESVKATDYKDVLNNQAADKRIQAQINADERRYQRDQDRQEKREKDVKYRRSVEIRKELSQNPAFKALNETEARLAQVDELAKNPNGVTDEAMLVMYQKALDPGSVVREGEFARTTQGQDLITRVDTIMGQVAKGNRLTPDLRLKVIGAMKALRDGNRTYMQRVMAPYEREIRDYDLDRNIITGPDADQESQSSSSGKSNKLNSAKDLP